MPFFSSSRLAYHCGYKTTAMLCSSGAKDNWQCKLTAVIRRQPCSVAVAPKLSHLSHKCKPCSVAMWQAMLCLCSVAELVATPPSRSRRRHSFHDASEKPPSLTPSELSSELLLSLSVPLLVVTVRPVLRRHSLNSTFAIFLWRRMPLGGPLRPAGKYLLERRVHFTSFHSLFPLRFQIITCNLCWAVRPFLQGGIMTDAAHLAKQPAAAAT